MTAAANIKCSLFIYGYSNLSLLQNKVHSLNKYVCSRVHDKNSKAAIENSQGCMEGGGVLGFQETLFGVL